ncbi:hypothetical protein DFH08DRAFT_806890 [Mycena albidolilacea]|uniref:Uncharacterized protein n=1 Tax=Mycena albidolilacea TaxID=1033008 RepID=A0AAD7ETI3_9AGAR|nr:hypothetical protein DFH08DRAFT_806890 [Mycena albidolilacea]
MKNHTSELLPSLLLGFIALIPNHTYTALGLSIALAIFCAIHFKFPATQLGQLAVLIDQSEENIRRAMVHTPEAFLVLRNKCGAFLSDFFRYLQLLAKARLEAVKRRLRTIPYTLGNPQKLNISIFVPPDLNHTRQRLILS